MHTLLGKNQLSHPCIIKGDQGVRQCRKFSKSVLCLFAPSGTLKVEGGGSKHNGECAFISC